MQNYSLLETRTNFLIFFSRFPNRITHVRRIFFRVKHTLQLPSHSLLIFNGYADQTMRTACKCRLAKITYVKPIYKIQYPLLRIRPIRQRLIRANIRNLIYLLVRYLRYEKLRCSVANLSSFIADGIMQFSRQVCYQKVINMVIMTGPHESTAVQVAERLHDRLQRVLRATRHLSTRPRAPVSLDQVNIFTFYVAIYDVIVYF